MTWETWGLYAAVLVVVCVTPGPSVFFVVTQASWRGPRAGVAAVLGIETANLIYWTLSAFGLAAAISASQALFFALKWAGALYLAWLGLQAIAGSFRPAPAAADAPRVAKRAFRDGLVVGLSNPKAMLFFVTLLPQFIDPTRTALPQVAALTATGVVVEMTTNSGYALGAGALRKALARSPVRRWFDRTIGAVFLALAGAAAFLRRAV
jgi:threonine/homoserine/homoserine lactone efflux protein